LAGGADALDPADGRCRVAVPDHPVDGQAGPPAEPAGPRAEPEAAEPLEVPRARALAGPAGPVATERPAPRDQPEAAVADPFDDATGPVLGGRSSGGALRPAPSVSAVVLTVAWPIGLATLREPELTSPSPSATGGASARSRDAYASPLVACPVPLPAAASADAAAAAPAPAPAVTPAASAAA
jgi:hypothetical protein